MNRRQTYEQANKIYDKAMKLEQEFGEYFTGKNSLLCHPSYGDLLDTQVCESERRLATCMFLVSLNF